MPGIRELALRHYDNKESVAACQEFFDDSENTDKMERAFNSVLPILGIIIRKEFRNADDYDTDDLIQIGAIEFWKLLDNKNKKPRPFDSRSHLNLYYKVGVRAMLKIRDQIEPEVIDFFTNNANTFVAPYNFNAPDQRIFARQIPKIIFDKVMAWVSETGRFSDEEEELCRYIAKCMAFETRLIDYQIRKIVGLNKNIEFFKSYIDTLIRMAYIELKGDTDITSLLGDEGASMNPIYYSLENVRDE